MESALPRAFSVPRRSPPDEKSPPRSICLVYQFHAIEHRFPHPRSESDCLVLGSWWRGPGGAVEGSGYSCLLGYGGRRRRVLGGQAYLEMLTTVDYVKTLRFRQD